MRHLYARSVAYADGWLAHVLEALDARGVLDETLTLVTSDHGENLGEHGLWWKNTMYEQAARVPLIVSWPACWAGGQRRTAACSLVDLVQTIAALGGAAVPDDWDGDSLLPWLDDRESTWKDLAVSEYYAHNIASGYVMLRTGPHKYVYHTRPDEDHPPERELYDLTADPDEFDNLAARPEHRDLIGRLHATLLQELGEDPEETEQRCRADATAPADAPPSR